MQSNFRPLATLFSLSQPSFFSLFIFNHRAYARAGKAAIEQGKCDQAIEFYERSLTEYSTPDVLNDLVKVERAGNDNSVEFKGILSVFIVSKASKERIKLLGETLLSIQGQVVPADRLCIFVSNVTAELRGLLESLKSALASASLVPEWFEDEAPRSQFWGFRDLIRRASDRQDPNQWIMFGDDDDLWHPLRVKWYRTLCAKDNIQIVCVNRFLRTDGKMPDTLSDLKKIREDELWLSRNPDFPEYWLFGVRSLVLANFFQDCDDLLINHKYCDLLFARYLLRVGDRAQTTLIDDRDIRKWNWGVFYRKDFDEIQVSTEYLGLFEQNLSMIFFNFQSKKEAVKALQGMNNLLQLGWKSKLLISGNQVIDNIASKFRGSLAVFLDDVPEMKQALRVWLQ